MPEVQDSIRVLRARGYKVTQPRKQVLKVLAEAEKPVSPYDIQKILQEKGQHLNHVTIYRILDLFCLLDLAHRILLLGGFVKCTLGDKEGCHRFMVCRHCGGLQEFADKALCEEENEIAQDLGFCAEHHFSEFFGVCSKCHG
ncbi:MAG: transcriptional repressor [Dehalococcoidia bacterium]|nr:transcriptional repressor [Dehalococcoidia bacterium]